MPYDSDYLLGLSRASLKKYSSAARQRHAQRAAAEQAARDKAASVILGLSRASQKRYSSAARARMAQRAAAAQFARDKADSAVEGVGFGLPKIKLPKLPKLDVLKKINAVAKVAGPIVATVVPGTGPLIGAGMALLNAAEKGDAGAIANVAETVARASGNPEAAKALEVLKTAKAIKNQIGATDLLKKADAGDPAAKAKIDSIKAAAGSNPKALTSFKALQDAAKGVKALSDAKTVIPAALPPAAEAPAKPALPALVPSGGPSRKSGPMVTLDDKRQQAFDHLNKAMELLR